MICHHSRKTGLPMIMLQQVNAAAAHPVTLVDGLERRQ
jgi:hypothetical protein